MEFVWRLPLSFRIRNARSKWVLRQVLYKYVPRRLVERPKAGFSIPLASWLRHCRPHADDILLGESYCYRHHTSPVKCVRTPKANEMKIHERLTGDEPAEGGSERCSAGRRASRTSR